MTRHRKHAEDQQPWTVLCHVEDGGQVVDAELLVDAVNGTVSLELPGGPTCQLNVGESDRLAHFVLRAANTASWHRPRRSP